MTRTAITALAIIAALTGTAYAKQWTVTVIKDNGGQTEQVSEVQTCNYHEALGYGRTQSENDGHFFRMTGVDDATACPKGSNRKKYLEDKNGQ